MTKDDAAQYNASPDFTEDPKFYRIKPEPLEWWVVCSQSQRPIFGCPILSWGHETREAAEKEVAERHDSGLLRIIHVREVIDG